MKFRTTLYLPEELHHDLLELARQRRSSMAELLRAAAEEIYREEFKRLLRDPHRTERLANIRIIRATRKRLYAMRE